MTLGGEKGSGEGRRGKNPKGGKGKRKNPGGTCGAIGIFWEAAEIVELISRLPASPIWGLVTAAMKGGLLPPGGVGKEAEAREGESPVNALRDCRAGGRRGAGPCQLGGVRGGGA